MYLVYHEETKDEAQHRIWTFYEAIKFGFEITGVFIPDKSNILSGMKTFFFDEVRSMLDVQKKLYIAACIFLFFWHGKTF